MARLLILIGITCLAAGLLLLAANRLGIPFGRLPGDLSYRGKNVSVFAPLGTSLVLSVLLSVILYVVSRLRP